DQRIAPSVNLRLSAGLKEEVVIKIGKLLVIAAAIFEWNIPLTGNEENPVVLETLRCVPGEEMVLCPAEECFHFREFLFFTGGAEIPGYYEIIDVERKSD